MRQLGPAWWESGKVLAPSPVGSYRSRTMFPLISTLCLFGGLFLALVKVLLFAVEMVISQHRAAESDER